VTAKRALSLSRSLSEPREREREREREEKLLHCSFESQVFLLTREKL